MQRGEAGSYQTISIGEERVRAFVPAPLPLQPALELSGSLQQALEAATLALGRLDVVADFLPEGALFIYAYVRKEAVLSSQIEGTQSSLSDLLSHELGAVPGVPRDDVMDVSNYVAALEHGCRRLPEIALSNRLFREIHSKLLASGRGAGKMPGEFRRSQNWIGGTRPSNAVFIPPPHIAVPDCLAALERFLNAQNDGLPLLIRAALAHVQFETIHPFLDGNGRVGRLLISLLLCHGKVLRQPILYLSLYFKQHRSTYYDLLNDVRRTGDWEKWLAFFLEGVQQTATNAVDTSRRLQTLFADDRAMLEKNRRRIGTVLRLHDALKARPMLSLPEACRQTGLSFPGASAAMQLLVEHKIAAEITGNRRARLFIYRQYLDILNKGTERDDTG